jgi:hypothetical protein
MVTTPSMSWEADQLLVLALFRAVGGSTNIGVTTPTASGGSLDWQRVGESCMDGCLDNSKRIDAWIATTQAAGSGAVTMTSPIPADFYWSVVAYSNVDVEDPVARVVPQWPPTWWPYARVDFSPPIDAGNIGVGLFMLGGACELDAPATTMASPETTSYAHRQGHVPAGTAGIQCTYPEPELYHSAGIGIELRHAR